MPSPAALLHAAPALAFFACACSGPKPEVSGTSASSARPRGSAYASASINAATAPTPPPLPPRPFEVARRSTAHSKGAGVSQVVLGERWGCAVLMTQAGRTVECWDAPRVWTGHVQAWTVPWLRDTFITAGPERVCEVQSPERTGRCWQRPRRGESKGKELGASEEWLNPSHALSADTLSRSDRLAVGTWHACALTANEGAGLAFGGAVACWGRGDYGQLGAPAPDRCKVDGASVACAKTAQRGVRFTSPVLSLFVGDLYTCTSTTNEISCWGASRDGFFGTRAQCPARLRRAWPTLHGHVPAPRATCSLAPAKVSHVEGFQQLPSAGPRGICYDEDTPLRCIGGIRTPRGKGIGQVVVSTGEDASACGLQDEKAVCWGEGYSRPGAPAVPLEITLEIPPTVRETAVIESKEAERYSANCLVHRGCVAGPAPVPACPANVEAMDWSALQGTAAAHVGELVSVRGAVAVGPMAWPAVGCGMRSDGIGCCSRGNGPVVLGEAPALRLDRLFCAGDESLVCCDGPAYGETLIASGRLEKNVAGLPSSRVSDYQLTSVTFCKPK